MQRDSRNDRQVVRRDAGERGAVDLDSASDRGSGNAQIAGALREILCLVGLGGAPCLGVYFLQAQDVGVQFAEDPANAVRIAPVIRTYALVDVVRGKSGVHVR